MARLIWHWIISSIALFLAAKALEKGIHIPNPYDVIWIAPLLGLVNAVVGGITGIISFLVFPINALTLGCFGFVLSFVCYAAAIHYLGRHLTSFTVESFVWAAALAAIMALFSSVLNMLLPGHVRKGGR